MERPNYNRYPSVNSTIRPQRLKITKKAVSLLATAAVVLTMGGHFITKQHAKTVYNPANLYKYSSNHERTDYQSGFSLESIEEFNQKRRVYFNENGVKFNQLTYDLLQRKYYSEGQSLTKEEAKELYDQELLFEVHQKELLAIDTSSFSPFKYMLYTDYGYGEVPDEHKAEFERLKGLKEAYDLQRLSAMTYKDFDINLYGELNFKSLEKTLLAEEAVKLYDLRLVKDVHDSFRLRELSDLSFGFDRKERANELMYKYVTSDISPEEYLELYNLELVRKNHEKQAPSERGK